jgi:transcription elongation GreA/GreB family factor
MAANAMIRLTEHDYNRVKRLLAELTHQSMGMQATLKILEELVDVGGVVRQENAPNGVVTMNSVVHLQDVALRKKEG